MENKNTENQTPNTIPTSINPPMPTPAQKNNNSVIIVLCLLIAILVGVSAYLYGVNQGKLQSSQSQNNVTVNTPTEIPNNLTSTQPILPTTTPDSMTNWKTYTYQKYDYSFKYPSNYTVEERAPGFLVITSPEEHVAQGGISIESRLTGPYANYTNSKRMITTTNTISETKTINNWEIFQGIGNDGMLKGVEFRFGIAPYKTGAIEVETLANTQYINIFDQILATFKFTQ